MCGGRNMGKRCELCKGKARILCESDQARLCWNCDARVHSANFLVARHSRNLLCQVCKSPTPWSANGAKLRPTFAVCERCVDGRRGVEIDEEAEDAAVDEEVVGENQVVPWSPPPAPESSSSDEDSVSGGDAGSSMKRRRIGSCSSCSFSDEVLSNSSSRPNICTPSPSLSAASFSHALLSPMLRKNLKTEQVRVDAHESDLADQLQRFHRGQTDSSGGEITE
ncbi:zinc finger protein CONSTANS-LIKE 3-like [Andrographis paniculata]|uniref:zinc finger protein CONSTANS-LIKE 3-like n=1 Tax=Andrographis paniculata TaxID=175694 RepID=UPI0021E8DF6F|nr:zinc finger protein CONSTANS-LIKE 3-like [Andrographis paniculata]